MKKNINDISEKGFLDIKPESSLNLPDEIKKLKKEKNAVILGHFYQTGDIQEISDYVGDSLQLAQQAVSSSAEMIVFAGVLFMAETAKILNPMKKVVVPDMKAGCSLAESAPKKEFSEFLKKYPGYKVITYVNSSAEVKAMSDVICTSSNAVQIVLSFPEEQKLLFAPDKNLGNYINGITGRNMVLWDGACHVHRQFSLEKILECKKNNPDAKIIAHPECEKPILIIADFIGSTSKLLSFTGNDTGKKYIVVTESGIIYQMKKAHPEKIFIPAPPEDASCGCNDCSYMKLNTLEKIYICMKYELPEIT
jgi:quinolinate synthase